MSRQIFITDMDMIRLRELLTEALIEGLKGDSSFRELEQELDQAEIVDSKELPRNVITMNSKVLIDLNGFEEEVSLVYPHDADLIENRISILSPIGTAMLGYSEGDTIKCEVPSGKVELQIKRILYQPESAGDYHL
ncbi:MAG: nucleoside diphosphate kinase regulator [Eubacteriales bacterium]|nr:nucleoside diphosphate kinase regulator [Eubacteriales bacterium]